MIISERLPFSCQPGKMSQTIKLCIRPTTPHFAAVFTNSCSYSGWHSHVNCVKNAKHLIAVKRQKILHPSLQVTCNPAGFASYRGMHATARNLVSARADAEVLESAQWGTEFASSSPAHARALVVKDTTFLPDEDDPVWKQMLPRLAPSLRVGRVRSILAVLQRFRVTRDDLLANPDIVNYLPTKIEHAALTFAECGWSSLTIDMLTQPQQFLQNMTLAEVFSSSLKALRAQSGEPGNGRLELQVLHAIVNQLVWIAGITGAHRAAVFRTIRTWELNKVSLEDCRDLVLKHLLFQRLSPVIDEEFIETQVLRVNERASRANYVTMRRILIRPVSDMRKALDILLNTTYIQPSRIRKYPLLLAKLAEHYKALVAAPQFRKYGLHLLANSRPNIMNINARNLPLIEEVLLEHGITEQQIAACPFVFLMSVNTLRSRLMISQYIPTFKKFRSSVSFLKLIYMFSSVMPRIQALQAYDIEDYPVQLLLCTAPRLKECLKGTYTSNKALEAAGYRGTYSPAVFVIPAARFLECSCERILDRLTTINMHPARLQSSSESEELYNCDKTVQLLVARGVSKSQLWNGLSVLLFAPDVVADAMDAVRNNDYSAFEVNNAKIVEDNAENDSAELTILDHPKLLQLVLCEIARSRRWFNNTDVPGGVNQPQQTPTENVVDDAADKTDDDIDTAKSTENIDLQVASSADAYGKRSQKTHDDVFGPLRRSFDAHSMPVTPDVIFAEKETANNRELVESFGQSVHESVMRKIGTMDVTLEDNHFVDLFQVMPTTASGGSEQTWIHNLSAIREGAVAKALLDSTKASKHGAKPTGRAGARQSEDDDDEDYHDDDHHTDI